MEEDPNIWYRKSAGGSIIDCQADEQFSFLILRNKFIENEYGFGSAFVLDPLAPIQVLTKANPA